MGYTDRNRLKRIIDIQNITLVYKQKGENQEWIFNNVVEPTYRISRGTYYRYLSTPAKLALTTKDPRAFLRKHHMKTDHTQLKFF